MSGMQSVVRIGRAVLHAFGVRGVARRIGYVARVRSGWYRRVTPALHDYSSFRPLEWNHRFDLELIREQYRQVGLENTVRRNVIAEAEELLGGSLRFYGGAPRNVGWPPDWHRFPDGTDGPERLHWTRVSDDLPRDVKDLWEPSRFGFTFLLARAYVLTGDDRWVEAWWEAVEDWARNNRPNEGINWRCGQEASLRAIAWCFGVSAFGHHPSSTTERLELVQRMLTATVRRVRPTLGYALSQRNNHALSELVFLLSVGPDSHLERLLREALRDQWYEDGSYSQQSLNYERLAVHVLVWLIQVQRNLGKGTLDAVRACLTGATAFFERCSDPVSGRLPNSGANDGALLFDLDVVQRWDIRPTLDLLGAGKDSYESGIWLPSVRLDLPHQSIDAETSTFVTMRGNRSLLLSHVGPSRHRPGDDDQQSIELIIDGDPVVTDPGSYRYSGSEPWRQPFVRDQAHNAPHLSSPGRAAVGRFLRESSPVAHVVEHCIDSGLEVLVIERPLGEGVALRAVIRRDDEYAIVDRVLGTPATIRWLLAPKTIERVHIDSPHEIHELERSDDEPLSGWWAPLYGEREPSIARVVELRAGDVSILRVADAGGRLGLTDEVIVRALERHPRLFDGFRHVAENSTAGVLT